MLSILRKAKLKDKEMRILMLSVLDSLAVSVRKVAEFEVADLTMPERRR